MTLNIFDNKKYAKMAIKLSKNYLNQKPFPSIQIKNFLPINLAKQIYEEYPNYHEKKIWINYNNKNAMNKKSCQDERLFPLKIRNLFRELNSRQFILFLETLTGIDGLIPDPYFMGGGIHIAKSEGFLKKHIDFNWHHKLQAFRRVNVLIYLTPNWKKSYGGELELSSGKNKISHLPIFNSCVVFNTSDKSFHGHPQPLKINQNIFRRVLNIYYYTTSRNKKEIFNPTFTNYNKFIKKEKLNKKLFDIKNSPWSMSLKDNYLKLK